MRGYLVDSKATHPEMIRLTSGIDDFFDEVGEASDYVATTFDEPVELSNSSGLGTKIWTQDSLSLSASDRSTLRIERRWYAGRTLGRFSVARMQAHYDIGHHSDHLRPEADTYTTWSINPARGMIVAIGTGIIPSGSRSVRRYDASSPSFRDQAELIREVLHQGRNPLHRKTGQPFRTGSYW